MLSNSLQGQAFSENFNYPDGNVGHGWTTYGGGATILQGRLQNFGMYQVGGGIFRSLTETFPLSFSFDFATDTPGDGGWFVAINAVSAQISDPPAAQVAFAQFAGNHEIVRFSGKGLEQGTVGTEPYGSAAAHVSGQIQADLSSVITVTYADGAKVTANFGPATSGPVGSLFVLGNANATFGPHYFDNLQIGTVPPQITCAASPNTLWPADGRAISVTLAGTIGPNAVAIGSASFTVVDQYAQHQPSGGISLGAGGKYSVNVPLTSSRDEKDKNGRSYSLIVVAKDTTGNVGTCSTVVTVPQAKAEGGDSGKGGDKDNDKKDHEKDAEQKDKQDGGKHDH